MRKPYLVLLPFMCGLQIVSAPLPAAAYHYIYHPGVPAVEVDPSIFDDTAAPQDGDRTAPAEAGASEETEQFAPVPSVETAPVQPELKKPFFAAVPLAPSAPRPHAAVARKKKHAAPVVKEPVSEPPMHQAAPETASPAAALMEKEEALAAEAPKAEDKAPAVLNEEKKAFVEEVKPVLPQETAKAPAETPAPAETGPVVSGPVDMSLNFDATASNLSPQAQESLNGIVKKMQDKPEARLQIRGYAKGDDSDQGSARRLALSRALSVRSYLMDKGIKPVRLDVRALGSETDRMPIDRVDLVLQK